MMLVLHHVIVIIIEKMVQLILNTSKIQIIIIYENTDKRSSRMKGKETIKKGIRRYVMMKKKTH